MSVLACARRGCSSIMCDRYSYRYGYLCDDCFTQLVALGSHVDIEAFMNTPPSDEGEEEAESAFEKYDRIFKSSRQLDEED